MIRCILGLFALTVACASSRSISVDEIWPIEFRRTPCFGPCSAYHVTLEANGHAYMHLILAQADSPLESLKPGRYEGAFDPSGAAPLLAVLEEVNYFELDEVYDNPRVMDLPATESTIAGKRVYNRFQGPNLNALYFALDSMVFNVNWGPVQDN